MRDTVRLRMGSSANRNLRSGGAYMVFGLLLPRQSPAPVFMLDFAALSYPTLAGIFLVSAAAVWFGGSRLTRYVDAVTSKTGWGQAFTGMLLLGGITSLPEVAAVSTSAAIGNAPLAVNNLLGAASINILLLAFADVLYGRDALTAVAARPATLMQGVLSMLMATAVAMLATVGDIAIFGFGAGSFFLAAGSAFSLWMSSDYQGRHVWEVVGEDDRNKDSPEDATDERSLSRLGAVIALCALLILTAGFFLSSTADALTSKTGIAAGMIGFLLVAFATCLPEISSVFTAVRLHRYQMAVGDIFGTNLFNIMLIFLADVIYRGEPVLRGAGRFEAIGAILAVFLTGIFLVGLLQRSHRTILRMGYDALLAMLIFGVGIVFLSSI